MICRDQLEHSLKIALDYTPYDFLLCDFNEELLNSNLYHLHNTVSLKEFA